MCQASVHLISQGEEREVMRDVLVLETRDGRLWLTDLLGNEKELRARIRSIDFSEHKVIVEDT